MTGITYVVGTARESRGVTQSITLEAREPGCRRERELERLLQAFRVHGSAMTSGINSPPRGIDLERPREREKRYNYFQFAASALGQSSR